MDTVFRIGPADSARSCISADAVPMDDMTGPYPPSSLPQFWVSYLRMRFLLVHPWIADMAAFNFRIRPLGLYALAEWLWERGADTVLINCLSPAAAPGKFARVPVPPSLRPSPALRGDLLDMAFLKRHSELE
jgi:hypothetical protein